MQKPHQRILELYYDAWKQGYVDSNILHTINETLVDEGMPPLAVRDYRRFTPYFFNYTRERVYQETIEGTFSLEKTEQLEEAFLKFIYSGVPYDRAARALNIPLNTLMDVWFLDPVFKAKVDYAVEFANTAVTMALFKRAVGYTTKLRSVTKMKTADGNTVENTTVREEHVMPSVEAAKFWLINKGKGGWSLNGESSKTGNKSKILEAIEEMTAISGPE